MTSPIADMLTRIRNAQAVLKSEVVMPSSKLKVEICRILKENDYIRDFEVMDNAGIQARKNLKIVLKYEKGKEAGMRNLTIVSKPGKRVYAPVHKLPIVLENFGIAIISTSRGLMTNKEARKRRLGGEVICEVY